MVLYYLMTVLYVLVCFVLLLVILLQQGKGGDMASAFGGGSSQTAFGARGGATVLSKATTVFAVLFMLGRFAPQDFLRHSTVFVLACFVGWQVIWSVQPSAWSS